MDRSIGSSREYRRSMKVTLVSRVALLMCRCILQEPQIDLSTAAMCISKKVVQFHPIFTQFLQNFLQSDRESVLPVVLILDIAHRGPARDKVCFETCFTLDSTERVQSNTQSV